MVCDPDSIALHYAVEHLDFGLAARIVDQTVINRSLGTVLPASAAVNGISVRGSADMMTIVRVAV